MTKQLSYADSEKFRADAHKHIGFIFCTPFALSILKLLVEAKEINLLYLPALVALFILGYLLINNSYSMMKKRDEKYVRKYI